MRRIHLSALGMLGALQLQLEAMGPLWLADMTKIGKSGCLKSENDASQSVPPTGILLCEFCLTLQRLKTLLETVVIRCVLWSLPVWSAARVCHQLGGQLPLSTSMQNKVT